MNTTKVNINLTGVPRTLLLPLLGRAKLSKEKDSGFYDQRAIELINALNFDFKPFVKELDERNSMSWAGERALYFDNEVKAFLKVHPKGTVVNIGAGLETSFYRVDNETLTWIDLDVPEVIEIKQKLLPEPDRVHYIAKSVFDFTWMEEVKRYSENIFMFAGGVFVYFTSDEVKQIFIEMSKQLKGAEIVLDTIGAEGLEEANKMLAKFDLPNARLQWGIDIDDVKTWSPNIICTSHVKHDEYAEHDIQHFPAYMTKIKFI